MIDYSKLGWQSISGSSSKNITETHGEITLLKGTYSFKDERWLTEKELHEYVEYMVDRFVSFLNSPLGMAKDHPANASFVKFNNKSLRKWENTHVDYEEMSHIPTDETIGVNPF